LAGKSRRSTELGTSVAARVLTFSTALGELDGPIETFGPHH
jgi:hypothetical protein